jgi:hypothetical protein
LSLTGCEAACACVPTPAPITPPPGAISRDDAIAAAKRQAPPASAGLTIGWVQVQHNPLATDQSNAQLVWLVNLLGTFPLLTCPPDVDRPGPFPGPSLQSCVWKDEGLVAVIDMFSGQLIGWD